MSYINSAPKYCETIRSNLDESSYMFVVWLSEFSEIVCNVYLHSFDCPHLCSVYYNRTEFTGQ